ncbi:hypothetical protein SCLCIDRAFT_1216512 [Scleroderma citrinum Foug A]|uniref:Granulins domain-containing protein n=1 Tax=Scleroderma citrinum Foug A TaxID=1036808 RepID=A0A0C3DX99_9AGAM|nr:hypothetical protein SCLCIDRAFT_1216512 [Scleroderma citrinum Foug A]
MVRFLGVATLLFISHIALVVAVPYLGNADDVTDIVARMSCSDGAPKCKDNTCCTPGSFCCNSPYTGCCPNGYTCTNAGHKPGCSPNSDGNH